MNIPTIPAAGSPPLLPVTVLAFRVVYVAIPIVFGCLLFLSVFGWILARAYHGNTRPWKIATIIFAIGIALALIAAWISVGVSRNPYIHL